MPNEVLVKQGTAIVWTGTGGNYALSMGGLTDDAARQAKKGDLTATRADRFLVTVEIKTGATPPTAGEVYEVYWAASTASADATDNPAGCSGSDAAYTGYNSNLDDSLKDLTFVGALACTAWTGTHRQQFVFSPPARYGMPVVVNRSGQTADSTDNSHKITLTPIVDEVQ